MKGRWRRHTADLQLGQLCYGRKYTFILQSTCILSGQRAPFTDKGQVAPLPEAARKQVVAGVAAGRGAISFSEKVGALLRRLVFDWFGRRQHAQELANTCDGLAGLATSPAPCRRGKGVRGRSGKRVGIVDPSTGKMREAEIFAVDFALNAHMRSRSPCPGFCQFIT